MLPTEILSQEHRVILHMLAIVEAMIDAGTRRGSIDGDDALQAVGFFRTFADECHHGKEEQHLFPKLIELGLPKDGGPIAVMLQEHEIGRAELRAMQENLRGAAAGDDEALTAFVEHARGFIVLLRDHIAKEDHVLFPMAAGFLTEAAARDVVAGFEDAERAHPPGTHADMLALATALGERYGVEQPAGVAAPSCGHHG